MHLCLLGHTLSPGGAERLICEEAIFFKENVDRVTLLVPDANREFLNEVGLQDDVDIVTYHESDSKLPFHHRARRVRGHLRRLDPDLVCSHALAKIAYVTTRGLDIPYTNHINDSIFWWRDNPKVSIYAGRRGFGEVMDAVPGHQKFHDGAEFSSARKMKAWVSERLKKRALQAGEMQYTLTDTVAREIEFLYDISPEVVRPGVSERWFDLDPDGTEDPFGSEADTILSVSRLDSRKRIDLLLEAFAELRERRTDVELVVGGTGPEGEFLRSLAADLDVAEDVEFTGYIPERDLPSYYAHADVFAHPAWVAYGLAPLEAYVAGTKTMISTDTLVKELIEGAPGVTVLRPDASLWAEGLNDAIASTPKIDPDIVPRWSDYCRDKWELMRREGLV